MGNITGNSQIINHGPDDLFIGDNEFASEVLSLAAATTAKDGYVLVHDLSTGKWAPATASTIDDGAPLGILALRDDITNSGDDAADYAGQRICIAGDVNKNLTSIGGTGLTAVQGEYLRVQGIYNVDAKQIGVQDNQ